MLDHELRGEIARLRSALESRGYLRPEAAQAIGVPIGDDPRRIDLPLDLRRLDKSSPLHTLIRLFALHVPVEEADARVALQPLELDEAVALGVVERRGGLVVPSVGFVVTDGLALARDIPRVDSPDAELAPDHVVGLNSPALLLARLTVRRPVAAALDVGCGGGVQSLLAARHAERVVGVDLNQRAIAFARFNAVLNDVANVEFREGSLFEPVAGERFDLIVCNPPYVISPETALLFRDGGREGDSFCEEVVQGAAAWLAPGGFATAIVNWVAREAEPWSRPIERWTAGRGCDAWLLRLDTSDVLTYAARWNRQPDPAPYADALGRWLAYYEARGITAIGLGAVVLRKRSSGSPWVCALDLPASPRGDASAAILQAFDAQDRLRDLSRNDALLGARFRVADGLRLTQSATLREGRFETGATALRLDGPLPFEADADAGGLRLLQLADGDRTLAEIAAQIGNGRSGSNEGLAVSLAEATRRLVTYGFLVPAEAAGRRRGDAATTRQSAADAAAARGRGGRRSPGPRRRAPGVGAR